MTRIFATFESIVNDDLAGKGGLSPWVNRMRGMAKMGRMGRMHRMHGSPLTSPRMAQG